MTADDLVSLFDLEPVGPDRYVGHSPPNGWKRVFGGQVIAQALIAAQRTVEGRAPHSLHAYFILGGDPREPIVFEVERIRDGRSFTTRRVVARQRGEAIFVLSASFQVEEEGLEHQFPMPDAPDPEALARPRPARRARGRGRATAGEGLLRSHPTDRVPPARPQALPAGATPAKSASRASRSGSGSPAACRTIRPSIAPRSPISPT